MKLRTIRIMILLILSALIMQVYLLIKSLTLVPPPTDPHQTLRYVLMFLVGVFVGAAGTWYAAKAAYRNAHSRGSKDIGE